MKTARFVGAAVCALTLALSGTWAAGASGSSPTARPAPNRDHDAAMRGAAAYMPPPPTWGACPTASLRNAGAQCAMVTVPRDYSQPWGTKIKLAVSRIRASAGPRQGVMLVNPGGPGGSGLEYSRLWPAIPNNVGATYDWIGFDPRGVGHSTPKLTCDGNHFGYNRPDYRPTTAALENTWLAKSKGYAAKCDQAGGALLENIKSTDSGDGHGHDPQGPGCAPDQLLRVPTAPTSVRSTPRCPDPGPPDGLGRRGRPRPGLVPRQPRPGRRLRQEHRHLLRVDRQERRDYHLGRTRPRSRASTTTRSTS